MSEKAVPEDRHRAILVRPRASRRGWRTLLKEAGLAASTSEANRKIEEGAVGSTDAGSLQKLGSRDTELSSPGRTCSRWASCASCGSKWPEARSAGAGPADQPPVRRPDRHSGGASLGGGKAKLKLAFKRSGQIPI